MTRHAERIRRAGRLALAAAMTAGIAACAKTPQEEARAEIVDGSSQSVTILGGIGATPARLARLHCSRYQKLAVLRDAEPAGGQLEVLATGSRPYLYHYDCL